MRWQSLSVIAAGLVIGAGILVVAAEPSANNNLDDEFTGKLVVVRTAVARAPVYLLENVKIIKIGEQGFIAGTGVKIYSGVATPLNQVTFQGDWWHGSPVRLNVRLVESYYPLTPEQWNAFKETWNSGRNLPGVETRGSDTRTQLE